MDASAYVNQYRDFIGYVIGIKSRFESAHPYLPINPIVFRYSTNSKSDVITHGWSIGVDFAYNENIIFRGNYSYNSLRKTNENDPIIPAYNTPKHKFNIGLAGKDLKIIRIGSFTKSGFNVNYKWVDGFQFEGSPQFTGQVRSYGVVDAQINISSDKFHTQVKVGCANLLGQQYAATYGGPTIGRQAYVQVRYDLHR